MKANSRIGAGASIAASVLWAFCTVPALAQTGSSIGGSGTAGAPEEVPGSGSASGSVTGSGAAGKATSDLPATGKSTGELKTNKAGSDTQALTGEAEEEKKKASEKLPAQPGQLPGAAGAKGGASASGGAAGANAEAESGMQQ